MGVLSPLFCAFVSETLHQPGEIIKLAKVLLVLAGGDGGWARVLCSL